MNALRLNNIRNFFTQNAIYVILVLLVVGIALYDPNFLGVQTLRDILLQNSTGPLSLLAQHLFLSQEERIYPLDASLV